MRRPRSVLSSENGSLVCQNSTLCVQDFDFDATEISQVRDRQALPPGGSACPTRSLGGSVITAAPGCVHRRLVDLNAYFAIATVVLRIAGIVAQHVLAPQIPAHFFHRV